jgi:hypothetical protein
MLQLLFPPILSVACAWLVEVAFAEIELAEARSTQDRRQLNSQFPQLSAISTIVRSLNGAESWAALNRNWSRPARFIGWVAENHWGRAGPAATDGKQRYWRCRHSLGSSVQSSAYRSRPPAERLAKPGHIEASQRGRWIHEIATFADAAVTGEAPSHGDAAL